MQKPQVFMIVGDPQEGEGYETPPIYDEDPRLLVIVKKTALNVQAEMGSPWLPTP